jgi:hypothetical protein
MNSVSEAGLKAKIKEGVDELDKKGDSGAVPNQSVWWIHEDLKFSLQLHGDSSRVFRMVPEVGVQCRRRDKKVGSLLFSFLVNHEGKIVSSRWQDKVITGTYSKIQNIER